MTKKKAKEPTQVTRLSDKEFFDTYAKDFLPDPNYHTLFEVTAQRVVDLLHPKTFLDLGTGPGLFPHYMQKLGVESEGFEPNPHFIAWHKENGKSGVLTEQNMAVEGAITKPYDLIACIEVFEHMTDEHLAIVLPQIAYYGVKHFLFSSTPNRTAWDEPWGHINIKTREQWIALFAEYGLTYFADMELPTMWTMVFKTGGVE